LSDDCTSLNEPVRSQQRKDAFEIEIKQINADAGLAQHRCQRR
jgi:hypothetical protein